MANNHIIKEGDGTTTSTFRSNDSSGVKTPFHVLYDFLSGAAATIKAASTPSQATDTAMVVTAREVFSRYRNTALSNTPDQVKSTAAALRGWNIINVNAVPVYVKLYDALAASVTVGMTAPFLTLEVPPQISGTPGCIYMEPASVQDRTNTALTIACVTGLADASAAQPTTPIHVSLRFE